MALAQHGCGANEEQASEADQSSHVIRRRHNAGRPPRLVAAVGRGRSGGGVRGTAAGTGRRRVRRRRRIWWRKSELVWRCIIPSRGESQ
jgi:hypothetical protein